MPIRHDATPAMTTSTTPAPIITRIFVVIERPNEYLFGVTPLDFNLNFRINES